MTSGERKINRYAEQVAEENRRIAILNGNGRPARITIEPAYTPGPLAAPIGINPLAPDENGTAIVPVFGGATRVETIASRLLAGVLNKCDLLDLFEDQNRLDRRRIARAAVVMAAEIIESAHSYGSTWGHVGEPTAEDSEE